MSFRFILIAIAIWIGVIMYRNYQSKRKIEKARTLKQSKNIVPCAVCGVHIPESEAIKHDEKFFCSSAHLDQANK